MPYEVRIPGLRDMRGRFASMADTGLRAIQLEEAGRIGTTIRDVFRAHAPRSQRGVTPTGKHFFAGIDVEFEATGGGFEIRLTTDKPDLRRWLTEGTGVYGPRHQRIFPKKPGGVLMWTDWLGHGSGPFFAKSIAGMKGRPWEQEARDEVEPLVEAAGNRIGVRVVQGLADQV